MLTGKACTTLASEEAVSCSCVLLRGLTRSSTSGRPHQQRLLKTCIRTTSMARSSEGWRGMHAPNDNQFQADLRLPVVFLVKFVALNYFIGITEACPGERSLNLQ